MGTDLEQAENVRETLKPVRKRLQQIDELTYRYPGLIKGSENHELLVNTSDFGGDYCEYNKMLEDFMSSRFKTDRKL